MAHPSAWRRYMQARKGGSPDPGLARFAARFRLAKAFDGVTLEGFAEQTEQAYSESIRVALSYSAVEALDSALGRPPGRDQLSDAKLAGAYRSRGCEALRSQLEDLTQSRGLQERLAKLAADPKVDNVMPVAAALRHLVFHGDFTTQGGRTAQSKAARDFMGALANALLDHADDNFELYLDREALGPWDVRRHETCPSCGVSVGQIHGRLCDIALCKTHGQQRSTCFEEGRHQMTRYWGVFPGTIEAFKHGWVIRQEGRDMPNIVEVVARLEWDPKGERFV